MAVAAHQRRTRVHSRHWWLVAVMTLAGVADGYGFTAGQVAVSRSVPEERRRRSA